MASHRLSSGGYVSWHLYKDDWVRPGPQRARLENGESASVDVRLFDDNDREGTTVELISMEEPVQINGGDSIRRKENEKERCRSSDTLGLKLSCISGKPVLVRKY